ncbi:MAG: ABC transporter ATP-binding protein, partial [Polyangiaceae bacterium]
MDDAALVSSAAGDATVRVAGLSKRYGRRVAVRDVGFRLGRGEVFGLIGPDGAGKSSVMKAVAGVLSFDAGTVEVLGVRIDSERSAERVKARIGFMPQGLGLNLYPNLSVEENVDFFARMRDVTWADLAVRKRALLGMTRLDRFRDRPMKHLSGGMKQKLGLVCTLIHEPDVVVLDEPTTGVDPVSRRDFWRVLAELLQERNVSALVSTAYLDEASRFHRVSLRYEGRERAGGDPRDLA